MQSYAEQQLTSAGCCDVDGPFAIRGEVEAGAKVPSAAVEWASMLVTVCWVAETEVRQRGVLRAREVTNKGQCSGERLRSWISELGADTLL